MLLDFLGRCHGPNTRAAATIFSFLNHRLAFGLMLLLSFALLTATALSAIGYWPWIELQVMMGRQTVENAGMYAQIGLTILAVLLASFLSSMRRVMALETSHRDFSIGIEDVARAYHHAHAADRVGTFSLSSEFETMRERLTYLRAHPDLEQMEPELLELAARMSYISRDLAETYSDENVVRARDFLRQRQQEVERFNKRLDEAKTIHNELKHRLIQLELEESVAAAQLERLRDEFLVILPEMGIETIERKRKVIDLPRAAE
ncbi:DNA repair protein [Marimonas lutisalis]|uniref:DNA repair protein n=1 Tax=Marimonas lutisalis TaxID=2545756 RepID=UPI001F196615|nr:DNA repair protein [Marimonas lutisalis]